MSEWISVKDRLPEKYISVLLFAYVGYKWEKNRKTKLYISYWNDDYGLEWLVDCDCSGYEHDREKIDGIKWMPLPKPPKD